MRFFAVLLLASTMLAANIQLSEATRSAYDSYINRLESQMDKPVLDRFPELRDKARAGEVLALPFAFRSNDKVANVNILDGLVSHWLGVMFVPKATVEQVRAVLQNYGQYSRLYAPDVVESSILKSGGDDFDIFLRLHRQVKVKALMGYNFPVEFNTHYHVRYFMNADTLNVRSVASRIAEVKDPKKSHTEEHAVGNDNGYLWRLRSYWRVTPAQGGVFVECEAVSLSRSVPSFVEKMVTYFTTNFPEDSMRSTLQATKNAVVSRSL